MRQTVVELALPMLSHPGSTDLLMGYAILLESWMLLERLEHPAVEDANQESLYRILGSLADGTGGYLAPLFAALGAT